MKIKLGCWLSPRSFYVTLVLILLHTCAHIQTQFIGDECKEKVALAILCLRRHLKMSLFLFTKNIRYVYKMYTYSKRIIRVCW